MKEIELKYFVPKVSLVRKRLVKIGAVLVYQGFERVAYFNSILPKLTIRVKYIDGVGVYVVLKKSLEIKSGVKECDEINIAISDSLKLQELIDFLGEKPTFIYKKKREHWKVSDHLFIELDTLEDGRQIVEIEAESKEKIFKLAKLLKIDDCESTTKTYPELLGVPT